MLMVTKARNARRLAGQALPDLANKENSRLDKTRVLVADDEPAILELIAAMLEPHGFEVTTAPSAREALTSILKANAERTPFQLVITDISMPGMSGFGLLHNLKAMEPGLPVIAITGYPMSDLSAQLKECGCRLCLCKPFTIGQLLEGIEQIRSVNYE
jgi:CheY-like chemotaxis protein